MLKERKPFKDQKIAELKETGYPVYITSAGWLGYSDDRIRQVWDELLSGP